MQQVTDLRRTLLGLGTNVDRPTAAASRALPPQLLLGAGPLMAERTVDRIR